MCDRLLARALGLTCVISLALTRPATAAPAVTNDRFAACEPTAGEGWSYDRLMCLRQAGTDTDRRADVVHRLTTLGADTGQAPWATLVLAHVRLDLQQRPEAVALYERAAELFAARGEAEGEIIARQNLATQYRLRGEPARAAQHVTRTVAAADASGDPLLVARAAVVEAAHATATGGDIGHAWRVLVRADRLVPPTAPIGLRRTILVNLANASLLLGDPDTATDALERHRRLRAEDGATQGAAAVEFNLLVARLLDAERRPRARAHDQLVRVARQVVGELERLPDPVALAQAHGALADLLAQDQPAEAATHLDRCLEIARALQFPGVRAACLWSQSRVLASRDPRAAQRASEQALALLHAERDRVALAYAWQARLRLLWRALPTEDAIDQSRQAIDALERLRSVEGSESSRTGVFGNWMRDYQWLIGELLALSPRRTSEAFAIGERLRARVLLEHLARAGAVGRDQSTAAATVDRRGDPIAIRIAATQRRLQALPLDARDRSDLLVELQLLELERDGLGSRPTGQPPGTAAPEIRFSTLAEVQRQLADDEAMLWYSVAPDIDVYAEAGGGAWCLVITSASVTVHRLSLAPDLDAQVAGWTGILRARGAARETWAPAARRFGDALLGPVLPRVPPRVTRLIAITDGPLHQLPFEALAIPVDGSAASGVFRTLGEQFSLAVSPSASVWMRTREAAVTPVQPVESGALVLADPAVAGSPDGRLILRGLPGARREAHAIANLLQLPADAVREGRDASEGFIKQVAFTGVRLLHLAVHARADAAFPDRSALFLAPGDAGDDGWLQPREIAALDLRGRVVVLSACDAAEGSVQGGEGTLSLARAFFAAGASTVVATRWPIRDDDAALMMARFYTALTAGADVAAALRQARLDARAAGLPAAAWAGVTVFGDGGSASIPRQSPVTAAWRARRLALLASLILLAVAALGLFATSRRYIRSGMRA